MTAALTNTQSINTLYPQAGIDNSSQGFRDNFNHIQLALSSIDTYMDALAGTTLNVNASVITGTQLVSALTNLELGTSTVFNIGQLSDIVIIGKNPDGSSAAGSVGFFNDGSATPFQNFSVLTYNEAQAIISETFSSNLILTAGDNSDAYTNGTLVVEGGVGIGKSLHVGGDINVDGNLIIGGNLINTSSNVTFNGITITGNLTLKDSNNDSSPSIILNTTSFINYFSASDNITVSSATVVNSNLVTGYQVLPTGLIMMWGTTQFTTDGGAAITIPFPTLPGQTNPGFPNACLNLQLTNWNWLNDLFQDVFPNIVSYVNTSFVYISNSSSVQNRNNPQPFTWFAIGN